MPLVIEQRILASAVIVEHLLQLKRTAALRAARFAEAKEVVPAMLAGQLFDRDRLIPIEFQAAGRTGGLHEAAQVVTAPRAADLERHEIPVRAYAPCSPRRMSSRTIQD